MFFRARTISKLAIKPPKPKADRGDLSICLIVRNEARHVAEWGRFHHLAGAEHIYVYDNGSTDGTVDALRDAVPDGCITVLPWDQKLSDARSGAELHNQVLAYAHCLRNFGSAWRWMAFIDVDEFIVPVETATIPAALALLEEAAHVSLPWHMFGRNGHDAAPSGGVLENYLNRARDPLAHDAALNWKCIVDPCRVTAVRVHGFDVDGAAKGVNDLGRTAAHAARAKPEFYSNARLQLNHYYTRSASELRAKIDRGSNKTVEATRHIKRVMRIVDAIEADTIPDTTALDFLKKRGVR